MAETTLAPGDICPRTGIYRCKGTRDVRCGRPALVNEGEPMPQCQKCGQPGVTWSLVQVL